MNMQNPFMQTGSVMDVTTERLPGSNKLYAGASGAVQTENFNSAITTPY